jgi:hypothetical protein|nr:MAG TPA: hypothetical protein [Caudoviricetes sp.]
MVLLVKQKRVLQRVFAKGKQWYYPQHKPSAFAKIARLPLGFTNTTLLHFKIRS